MMMKKKTNHKHILSYQTEFPRAAISQHDNIVGYVSEEKNIELSILDSEHFEHAETERSRDTRLPERCICYSKNQTKKKTLNFSHLSHATKRTLKNLSSAKFPVLLRPSHLTGNLFLLFFLRCFSNNM